MGQYGDKDFLKKWTWALQKGHRPINLDLKWDNKGKPPNIKMFFDNILQATFDNYDPYAHWKNKGQYNLVDSPVTFSIKDDDIDKVCGLTFNKTGENIFGPYGDYMLTIEEVLANEMPPAPAIKRENLDPVCRSEVLEYEGETLTRVDWLLFLIGLPTTFTAEYNRRTQTCTISVAGKMVL